MVVLQRVGDNIQPPTYPKPPAELSSLPEPYQLDLVPITLAGLALAPIIVGKSVAEEGHFLINRINLRQLK